MYVYLHIFAYFYMYNYCIKLGENISRDVSAVSIFESSSTIFVYVFF